MKHLLVFWTLLMFTTTSGTRTNSNCNGDWKCMGKKIAQHIVELQNRVRVLEQRMNQQQQNEIEALNELTGIREGAVNLLHTRNQIRTKKSATLDSLMKNFGLS